VSRYQKGETKLDFTEARDSEWQWHQLGHMQVCTSFQTDNHTNTSSLNFYRLDALRNAQPTVSKHRRQQLFSDYKVRHSHQPEVQHLSSRRSLTPAAWGRSG